MVDLSSTEIIDQGHYCVPAEDLYIKVSFWIGASDPRASPAGSHDRFAVVIMHGAITMDIKLVDIIIHIDETLSHDVRQDIDGKLRTIDGVVSVANHDDKSHLLIIEYNPDRTSSSKLLSTVRNMGVHAEMIGL